MTLQIGTEAPGFELEPLGVPGVPDPSLLSLGTLLARGPLLLIFAKSSCPTCQWCLPLLDRLHRGYGDRGASAALVLQDTESQARWFGRESQLTMPVLVEPEPYRVSEAYGVRFVPTSYFIGTDGRVELAIESFERESFKEVNARMARASGQPAVLLFGPNEGIPAFRPG